MTIDDLVDQVGRLKHVCVTGGEPFLHADGMEVLFNRLNADGVMMHVETSGTLMPKVFGYKGLICPGYWITCAPKLGALDAMIQRADEIKLLVDKDWDYTHLTSSMEKHKQVFVCPVNDVAMDKGNDRDNIGRCLQILDQFPSWRLSLQIHKYYGWR
jgi:organic radical activating enzyme